MNPRNVEEVIMDFKGRRAGIIKALTKDVEFFYNLCDPKHPSLCLYGLPSQLWAVNSPSSQPPPPPSEIPEPKLGINLIRDDMPKDEWLSMVALHSDAWLHSVASYFSIKYKFDKSDRKRLYNKISDMCLISELIMYGAARKRGKTGNRGLPNEIVVEVLARLPVKDLLRYRTVCNNWRSLIDDPNFVNAHLRSYKSNIVGNQLLVSMERPRSWLNSERVLVRHSDTFRKVTTLNSLNLIDKYDVLGYVNGLVLVRPGSRSSSEVILWNPSMNKSINVPNIMINTMQEKSYYEFGLGFDASINDYKVVLFTYPYTDVSYNFGSLRYRAKISGLIQVYSLSANSWTTKNGAYVPSPWAVGPQVYVNGAINWMGFGPNDTDDLWATSKICSHIVSFDVGNEVFNYFELPVDVVNNSGNRYTYVVVIDGCLALICTDNRLHDIWVMKEYGNSNSWGKCYTFSLRYDNRLHFKENGEFLYGVDDVGIKSYDVKKNCVRDLAKTYNKASIYTVFTHVESLLLSTISRVDN
ncbi:hypothetical protein RND81_13G137700 [Saponaria officinalis]|uniref:PHD finger protein ALFIN-LIKE n=1 Tax=Saponaria officinalis TaxID=3572 RepID=A0AAW1GXH2_SAPOF